MALHIIDHPLLQHRLDIMRDQSCPSALFRRLLREIAVFLTYEAAHDLATESYAIKTPLIETEGLRLAKPSPVLVSILRAGNGLLDGALEALPTARVGFLGMYRDETTLRPVEYYENLPADLASAPIFVLDPMLATGNSLIGALKMLQSRGANSMRVLSLLAAPEGVAKVNVAYPDLDIYTVSLDDHLNEKGYIVPGLGDAGDRIFNSN